MQILRWLGRKLSQSDDLGLPGSDAYEFVSAIHEEIDRKKYDKARDLLLSSRRLKRLGTPRSHYAQGQAGSIDSRRAFGLWATSP